MYWRSENNPCINVLFVIVSLQAKIVEKLLGFEVTSVACGASHMIAVTNEHEVFAWGRGDNGESIRLLSL